MGSRLLNKIYDDEQKNCVNILNNQTVNFSIDGWSNIRNDPIICASVTKDDGKVILVDTIDTSGEPHDSNYLTEMSLKTIKKVEKKYNCKINSFVTDNAPNMATMRKNICQTEHIGDNIITYGLSAHILNLLAQDLGGGFSSVNKHVLAIIKYFRNKHLPKAWYNQAGGKLLSLPSEVRWNTISDSLQSYIENWPALKKVFKFFSKID